MFPPLKLIKFPSSCGSTHLDPWDYFECDRPALSPFKSVEKRQNLLKRQACSSLVPIEFKAHAFSMRRQLPSRPLQAPPGSSRPSGPLQAPPRPSGPSGPGPSGRLGIHDGNTCCPGSCVCTWQCEATWPSVSLQQKLPGPAFWSGLVVNL